MTSDFQNKKSTKTNVSLKEKNGENMFQSMIFVENKLNVISSHDF